MRKKVTWVATVPHKSAYITGQFRAGERVAEQSLCICLNFMVFLGVGPEFVG